MAVKQYAFVSLEKTPTSQLFSNWVPWGSGGKARNQKEGHMWGSVVIENGEKSTNASGKEKTTGEPESRREQKGGDRERERERERETYG
jgi:hypothetical protein